MNKTAIEWTTFSSNPLKFRRVSDNKVVWGCVKVSPGCANCYSEAIALRFDRGKLYNARNMEELKPFLDEDELRKMLNAKTVGGTPVSGSKVFVGDMTDLFGEWVPDEMLDRLFAVFAMRPDVDFQVLTKRAERMRDYLARSDESPFQNRLEQAACDVANSPCACGIVDARRWPLDNVWLGVSAEDQPRADERLPLLLQTPAAVRFVSFEPLLGAIDANTVIRSHMRAGQSVDWAIIGGESGKGARPCNVAWVQSLVEQCRAAGVPCFVKQLGANVLYDGWMPPAESDVTYFRLRDPKGGDMDEWPEDLRVREFPKVQP